MVKICLKTKVEFGNSARISKKNPLIASQFFGHYWLLNFQKISCDHAFYHVKNWRSSKKKIQKDSQKIPEKFRKIPEKFQKNSQKIPEK